MSPSAPATPSRRFTDAHPIDTAVGPGIHVKGVLRGSGSVEIAGTFEGPIEVDGLLHVLEGGKVVGETKAQHAVIEGELQGRIVVAGRLELSSHARVRADVEAPTIAIAEGSVFDGRVNMGAQAPESTGAQPTAAAAGGAPQAMTFREKRRHKRHRHHPQPFTPSASAPVAAEAPLAPAPEPAAPPAAAAAAPVPEAAPAVPPAPPSGGKPPAEA